MNAVILTILATATPILLAGAGWLILQLINSRAQVVILQEEVKRLKETLERQSNDAVITKKVNDEISNLTPDAIRDELQRDWKEPPKQ